MDFKKAFKVQFSTPEVVPKLRHDDVVDTTF